MITIDAKRTNVFYVPLMNPTWLQTLLIQLRLMNPYREFTIPQLSASACRNIKRRLDKIEMVMTVEEAMQSQMNSIKYSALTGNEYLKILVSAIQGGNGMPDKKLTEFFAANITINELGALLNIVRKQMQIDL